MRVALVHYHLLRGGVSSVIRNQAKALQNAGDDVLLISGDAAQEKDDLHHAIIGDLRYDSVRGGSLSEDTATRQAAAEKLGRELLGAMEQHWGAPADVLHVHNPLIRKNSLLLPALRFLQTKGVHLLLQNHDFAEDFRPDVYAGSEPYPENCHYAAINSRDHSFLHRSGLEASAVHLLPDAVNPLKADEGHERTRYLYPVRAIRRKNIGEALLLSMFIPKGCTVAITLPPTSNHDEPVYQHWKELASRLDLPLEFECGMENSLSELLGSSVCVLTTSVKEGFGFSFLEPWTAGREVIGRRVEYVCRDFESAGVQFDSLYTSLDIPLVYLPSPILRRKLEKALISAYSAFDLELPSYALKMMTDDLFSRDVFDFGRLDEELQTDVLEMLASNDAALQDIIDVNPFLKNLEQWKENPELIRKNKECILNTYNADAVVRMLHASYASILDHPVEHHLSKSILLELFLDPSKISLVGIGHD